MDTLTPFMLEAKREYLSRLNQVIAPFVLRDMLRMYDDAAERGEMPRDFQAALRQIPKWNAGLVREKTSIVETKCTCLSMLIAASFISFIKVMSSVRVSQDERPNIRLKLPTNDIFVHRVYTETARALYSAPYLLRDGDHATKVALVYAAVETTVRDLLPIEEILSVYLGDTVDKNGTMAPILSPVHSDDDEPSPPADDSGFDRAAQAEFPSSDDDDDAEVDTSPKEQTIAVPPAGGMGGGMGGGMTGYSAAPMPPPMPPPMPAPSGSVPVAPSGMPSGGPSGMAFPQAPPHAPSRAPLFDDAEDGHFT